MASSPAESERSSLQDERRAGAVDGIRTLHLDHDLGMVGVARRELRCWLRKRGCTTEDRAALVLSELVTNAMVHARAGCTIEMEYDHDWLRLEVRDPSPAPPVIAVVRPHDIGGRGLQLVDAIAEEWGWESMVDGKRVWANIDARVRPVGADEGTTSKPS